MMVAYLFTIIVAYLLGSLPSGLLIGKWLCNIDIRNYGSKNIGTTNMFRTLGAMPASLVFVIDVLKGVLAVVIARYLVGTAVADIVAGIVVVMGHNYSCWLNFKGGRGVATALGLMFALMPKTCVGILVVWAIIVFLTRYVSLASIVVALMTPFLGIYFAYPMEYVIFSAVIATFIIVRHKENIERLIAGTENKIKSGKVR